MIKILLKNGFLSHYGRMPIRDTYGTTIPYQRFAILCTVVGVEGVGHLLAFSPEETPS
jgi:hypothetical protein